MSRSSALTRLLPFAVLALLAACQSNPQRIEEPIAAELERAAEANQGREAEPPRSVAVAPPPEVIEALLPPLTLHPGQERPQEPRYDIDVNAAPAREFFMGLVQGTPYNMVLHPQVDGAITLNLKNVTVPEVLEAVQDVYGYDYRRTRNGFQVLPIRLRSRIYTIDYLNLEREGTSNITVQAGRLSGSSGSDTGTTDTTTSSAAGTQITTRQTLTGFWQDLQSAITAIIGSEEGRSVAVNPQAGVLVVRAMPQELREVEEFLTEIQSSVSRQVILEAKILEVELSDGFQAGISWDLLINNGNDAVRFTQSGGANMFDTGQSVRAGSTVDLTDPTSSTNALPFTQLGAGVFGIALDIGDFTSIIDLLEQQGTVRVLSSPRVSTLNNQKAVIKVGDDAYYVTSIQSNTDQGVTSVDVELTPFFSGVSLDVTPQINREGLVTLHIHPSVVSVQEETKAFTVFGQAQNLPLAVSSTREADSVVRAANGQVIVIGGLLTEGKSEQRVEPPVLSDLPYMGWAFRHTREVATKRELIILLRPLVVDSGRLWTRDLRDTANRLRSGFRRGEPLPEGQLR